MVKNTPPPSPIPHHMPPMQWSEAPELHCYQGVNYPKQHPPPQEPIPCPSRGQPTDTGAQIPLLRPQHSLDIQPRTNAQHKSPMTTPPRRPPKPSQSQTQSCCYFRPNCILTPPPHLHTKRKMNRAGIIRSDPFSSFSTIFHLFLLVMHMDIIKS